MLFRSPEESWEEALKSLVPDKPSRDALRKFMRCTMGSNVGGDPAPDLRQVFRRGMTAWRAGKLKLAATEFINESNEMRANADFLASSSFKYPEIYLEIQPWMEKYLLGAEALEAIGNALQRCTFNTREHRIEGTEEVINDLESAVYKYSGSRKNMFGDQIDGPINELIAELSA